MEEEAHPKLSLKAVENSGEKDDDEVEYESDPDDALPLTLRRREASDDEDVVEVPGRRHRRVVIGSDGDSEGEGRPAAYEQEEDADLEEEEAYEEEEEEEDEQGRDVGDSTVTVVHADSSGTNDRGTATQDKESESRFGPDYEGDIKGTASTEEKKQSEPYAVPTAGAFYMHDDRFRDSRGARNRRTPGGRKLWESKEDGAWIHDRFEEMNIKEEQSTERRSSGGQFRGRGRTRGRERGSARGNRSRNFDENKSNKPPNQPQRVVKGRGPRRYEAARTNVDTMLSHDKQPLKSSDAFAKSGGGRSASATPSSQSEPAAPKKHAFASGLSSASPPFYPSGTSNQDTSTAQRRDLQNGNGVKSSASSIPLDVIPVVPNSSTLIHGKASIEPIVHDRVYVDRPVLPIVGKTFPNAQIQPSGSSSSVIAPQPHLPKVQERSFTVPSPISYQFIQSSSPIHTLPPQSSAAVQQRTIQGQSNKSVQTLSQRSGGGLHETLSTLPAPSAKTLPEVAEVESPPGRNKSKSPPVGIGKPINRASGQGFLYGGAQVIGAAGAASGGRDDQNFPPALLPVMQFGGKHHGGLGVPAVGMAFPGYVGQPQAGFGNSEMTWLPVLTGAAGALGASYAPYFALDGGYYRPTFGQTPSSSASRENSTDRSTNTIKAPESLDRADDEYGQRQNKPRRYSEMNFGQ